ncbi:hypothetical protein NQ036_06830 [Brevibacterium sp. 91QC2O2]|uniref:hypothetical protein n=1 Tax=Brevibacterium sp. 91QC2O2 TaxID=2968458 RepID=UPI00211C0FF3|nr:hypothetical protein [Brevibacterium sp. 91QC2O2]MCQ9367958.1 hypothetical protein [Brevibacterium sp. 91QC2O2]
MTIKLQQTPTIPADNLDDSGNAPDEDQPTGQGAGDQGEGSAHTGDDEDEDDDEDPEGSDALGDPGKKALDTMKAERNAERKARRDLEKRIADMEAAQANAGKTAEEQAAAQAERDRETAREAKTNAKLVRAEIKQAAAGKFRDPADALAFLDVASFDVDEDGDPDAEAIAEAIEDLLTRKPHLAAQGGAQSFDSGRGKPRPKKKLTKSDLTGMSAAAIAKAYDEGRIDM